MIRFILVLYCWVGILIAHPTTFKTGKVLWLIKNRQFSDLRFGYSASHKWLLGARYLEHNNSKELLFNSNWLIKRWNQTGAQGNLYLLTRSQMSKTEQVHSKETSLERKKKLLNLIQPEDKKFIQDFWSSFEDAYFNKFTSEKLLKHSEEIIRNKNKAFIINCEKKYGSFVEIFIKVDNADGLFLKLVKVISQSGLDVIDASIFTSIDNNLALNTFIAKYKSNDFEPNLADIKVLTQKLNNNFDNYNPNKKTPLSKKLNKNFSVPVKISSTEDIDNKKNLITIETSDSPDLLVKIAEIFYKNGTSIYSARINTLGNKVADTFEIEDMTLSTI